MKNSALITGASGGIGYDWQKYMHRKVVIIILVARN